MRGHWCVWVTLASLESVLSSETAAVGLSIVGFVLSISTNSRYFITSAVRTRARAPRRLAQPAPNAGRRAQHTPAPRGWRTGIPENQPARTAVPCRAVARSESAILLCRLQRTAL